MCNTAVRPAIQKTPTKAKVTKSAIWQMYYLGSIRISMHSKGKTFEEVKQEQLSEKIDSLIS